MDQSKRILAYGAEILQSEGQTLIHTSQELDPNFATAVEWMLQTEGRVVITGMGKSAQVGQKMVATFNSTGTPALFMHAADAIHGDLGILQKSDLLLCLSKSGNTPEIKILIPLVRTLGNKIIALVSDPNSWLEEQSDLAIRIPITREACPYNLTPTTSTTLQLAIGDAMALCLLKMRGFSPGDFAKLHPGGAIGKRLYLTVGDLYPRNERPLVNENDTFDQVILTISSHRLGATAVLNTQQSIVGIITDGDLRRYLGKKPDLASTRAADIMSTHPKFIGPDELAVKALEKMRNHSITQLLVMNQDQYLGVIHLHDILREGII